MRGLYLNQLYRQSLPKLTINLAWGLGLAITPLSLCLSPEKNPIWEDRRTEEGKKKKIGSGKLELIIFYDKFNSYFSLTIEHKTYKKLHIFMTENICSDGS